MPCKELEDQIKITEESLQPDARMHTGLQEFTKLIKMFYNYLEKPMDKLIKKDKKKMNTMMDTLIKKDKPRDAKLKKIKKGMC